MTDATERKIQTCPKCSEENPAEAVMCWACYSPLGNAKLAPVRLNDHEPELRFPQPSWWRDNAEPVGYCLVFGTMISSGWWRGKTRFGVLGAGLMGLALLIGLQKRAQRRRGQDQIDPRDSNSPICNIADTILIYAVKDGASQVRMTRHERGVDICYLLADGEWHQQMKIPGYVWRPLQNEFDMRAESGSVSVSPAGRHGRIDSVLSREEENATFAARILIEPPSAEILLTRL